MSEATSSIKPNILDYLNDECFQAVLDYVPVQDRLRSEPVSQRWQQMVLMSLRRIRLSIHDPEWRDENHNNIHRLNLYKYNYRSLERWIHKLGSSVVETYCCNEESLKIFGENCPNLEDVKFIALPEKVLLLYSQNENFKWLKRISFIHCQISDCFLRQFLNNTNALEELAILGMNSDLTGQFLENSNLKLKTFTLNRVTNMNFDYLLSAADTDLFSGLLELKLIIHTNEILYLDLLLDKLPHLEYLELYFNGSNVDYLTNSLCRLIHLKRLSLNAPRLKDEHVEAVVQCCKELQSLELHDSSLTSRGVAAVCREAGARLTTLHITNNTRVKNGDVQLCVQSCPNLKVLNVTNCPSLTHVVATASAARRALPMPRPSLHLYYTVNQPHEGKILVRLT